MGVVYEAEDATSGRLVALKLLPLDPDLPPEAFTRFEQEGRLAAAISHPRCVFVYGTYDLDGIPAIAMELQTGGTLEESVREGARVPIEQAIRWAVEILEGLEAAHAAGVLHRDVKPSNCFLSSDGKVKIGDFGLSRTLHADVRLTQSGSFLGSPLYASPEQVRGREVDERSDVYSAAATLYALLAGRSPFAGQSFGDILGKILTEDPPPVRARRPEVPKSLEAILRKALSKDPAKRFASAAALRETLSTFLPGRLDVAGVGKRFAAYLLDSMAIAALAKCAEWSLQLAGFAGAEPNPRIPGLLASPLLQFSVSTSVGVGYYTILEGMLGWSPGKWLLGLRVLGVRTSKPELLPALLRAIVFLIPLYACSIWLVEAVEKMGSDRQGLVFIAMGLWTAIICIPMRRRNGYRGVHEWVSGTRTSQIALPFATLLKPKQRATERARRAEGLPQSLGSYPVVDLIAHTGAGKLWLAKDPKLSRTVWIHSSPKPIDLRDSEGDTRGARVRWLEREQAGDEVLDIFEGVEGVALREHLRRQSPRDWSEMAASLAAVAHAIAGEAALSLDRLWVDDRGRVRIAPVDLTPAPEAARAPAELLRQCAQIVIDARGGEKGIASAPTGIAQALRQAATATHDVLEDVVAALDRVGRQRVVSAKLRLLQLLMIALPLMGVVGTFAISLQFLFPMVDGMEAMVAVSRADQFAKENPESRPEASEARRRLRDARLVVIASATHNVMWQQQQSRVKISDKSIIHEAVQRFPAPTEADVAEARKVLWELHSGTGSPAGAARPMVRWLLITSVALNATQALCLAAALLGALLLRGGFSLGALGLELVRADGTRASRLRCAWRAVVAGAPLFVVFLMSTIQLTDDGKGIASLAWLVGGTAACLATALLALRIPERGVSDLLAGTRMSQK